MSEIKYDKKIKSCKINSCISAKPKDENSPFIG